MKNLTELKLNSKLIIKISLILLLFLFGFLMFTTYARVLTGARLFTSDITRVIIAIALPVVFFSLALFIYTYLIIKIKSIWIIIIFPLSFLISQGVSLISLGGFVGLLASMFALRFYTLRNISDYKSPRVYTLFNNANGISFFIFSIVISLSFYSAYSNLIYSASQTSATTISSKVQLFAQIINNSNSSTISKDDTLESFATKLLEEEKTPVNSSTLANKEQIILNVFNVKGKPSDSMSVLLDNAIVNLVKGVENSSNNQLQLFIPLAFYFVNQSFSQFSAYLTVALLWLSEEVLKRYNVRINFS